jgi:hypothetical protein
MLRFMFRFETYRTFPNRKTKILFLRYPQCPVSLFLYSECSPHLEDNYQEFPDDEADKMLPTIIHQKRLHMAASSEKVRENGIRNLLVKFAVPVVPDSKYTRLLHAEFYSNA